MPRTLPAGTEAWLAKQGGNVSVPVILADIQCPDGTQFFWSDYEGTYLSELTGANQFYNGWIKKGLSFTRSRELNTDSGDLVVQNISGNTIDRDVAGALVKRAWIGSFAIIRLWMPLLDAVLDEFHVSLSEPNPTEEEASLHLLQLFDTSQYFAVQDVVSEICTLVNVFKGTKCGSTGVATVCDGLFTTCKDAQHAAQERFDGVLYIIPGRISQPPRQPATRDRNPGGGVLSNPSGRKPGLL